MDAFTIYALSSAGWLSLQAVPLLFTPKLIIDLLSPEDHHATDTERYLARTLALYLLTLSLILVFPSLPNNPPGYSPTAFPLTTPNTIRILTISHISVFLYIYMHYSSITSAIPSSPSAPSPNTTGLFLGMFGYGLLSCVGLWCVVFGTTPGHVSKRTGADKRTSGFPFKNDEAYNKRRDYAAAGKSL